MGVPADVVDWDAAGKVYYRRIMATQKWWYCIKN